MSTPIKQDFFNSIANEFDNHVRQSIPLFGEFIDSLRLNIANVLLPDGGSIIDICGSTGKFGHDLMTKEGWSGNYHNLDGSPQMIDICIEFKKDFQMRFGRDAIHPYLGGFMANWEDESGIQIDEIDLKTIAQMNGLKDGKFDIALEILGFQFFTKEREAQIKEMKRIARTCVFCEKFSTTDTAYWEKSEKLKDMYWKSKFFTKEEIEAKKKNVLEEMGEYLFNQERFVSLLLDNFNFVKLIYRAGNFEGYICSDEPLIKDYLQFPGLLNNLYNP